MNSLVHRRKANREVPLAGKALMDRVEVEFDPEETGVDGWPIRTVLVDDSPTVLKMLSLLLERHSGFLVDRHRHGRVPRRAPRGGVSLNAQNHPQLAW